MDDLVYFGSKSYVAFVDEKKKLSEEAVSLSDQMQELHKQYVISMKKLSDEQKKVLIKMESIDASITTLQRHKIF